MPERLFPVTLDVNIDVEVASVLDNSGLISSGEWAARLKAAIFHLLDIEELLLVVLLLWLLLFQLGFEEEEDGLRRWRM